MQTDKSHDSYGESGCNQVKVSEHTNVLLPVWTVSLCRSGHVRLLVTRQRPMSKCFWPGVKLPQTIFKTLHTENRKVYSNHGTKQSQSKGKNILICVGLAPIKRPQKKLNHHPLFFLLGAVKFLIGPQVAGQLVDWSIQSAQ